MNTGELLSLVCMVLLFGIVCVGLGWSVAARLSLAPAEKIGASVLLSLLGAYLVAWGIYVGDLPAALGWALPALAAASLATQARAFIATVRDPEARCLLVTQLIVSGWCLGWLLVAVTYVGGGWAGDWIEHWHRTRFFLERWPRETPLVGMYSLTARPPLVNVVAAEFLFLTRPNFVNFQVLFTLLSSLAFLPAGLLARRFGGGRRAMSVLGVLFMLNPLFVQNATFTWTKLPAAFFVLMAWYFFLRAHDDSPPRSAAPLFGAALAAGLLAHYSSGPYAVVLGGAWLVLGWRGRRAGPRTATATAVLAGTGVLATWFAWSFAVFGMHGTLSANTSVTAARGTIGDLVVTTFLNLRDTVVPHFLRPVDASFIEQPSRWGTWHDWWFQLYQLNLFFAMGCIAWLPLLVELSRRAHETTAPHRRFWTCVVCAVIGLGIAVHTPRDTWGLVHICLQPLILLGLAFLASRWIFLSRAWKTVLLLGATIDLALGLVLHFVIENDQTGVAQHRYGGNPLMNLGAKFEHRTPFLHDWFPVPVPVALIALALLLGFAAIRSRREPVAPAATGKI